MKMKKNKSIVLIGFMGSGKTSVGLKLSYRLKMPVEDTDKQIEQREKRTISEIFTQDGEAEFRRMETELLQQQAEKSYSRILSVGGGTPVNLVNRPLLARCGTVVWLRVRPETVYERLKTDTTRPLLQCENPLERITKLMEERRAAYEECADVIVDVDELDVNDILARIEKEIGEDTPKEQAIPSTRKRLWNGDKMTKILVMNGPNLNFLGIRERSVYGTQDYQYLCNLIQSKAKECNCEIECFQSNHEGAIIDRIQEAYFDGTQGIVINPGAYTHYSYAIRDALASITVPKVEIHISDITNREEFRKVSVTAPVCDKQIYGQGLNGYLQAIDFVLERIGG